MTEFMRNYAENVKICENVRLTPNNATNCAIPHPPHLNVAYENYQFAIK